jgi:hypothetical protein
MEDERRRLANLVAEQAAKLAAATDEQVEEIMTDLKERISNLQTEVDSQAKDEKRVSRRHRSETVEETPLADKPGSVTPVNNITDLTRAPDVGVGQSVPVAGKKE